MPKYLALFYQTISQSISSTAAFLSSYMLRKGNTKRFNNVKNKTYIFKKVSTIITKQTIIRYSLHLEND